jgi:hypothetical protein
MHDIAGGAPLREVPLRTSNASLDLISCRRVRALIGAQKFTAFT